MKIVRMVCMVFSLFVGAAAHSATYRSESVENMSFELECDGEKFGQQAKCEVTMKKGQNLKGTTTFQTSDKNLLLLEEIYLEGLSNALEGRSNNRYGGYAQLSDSDKEEIQKFNASNMTCMKGKIPNGATFIWCSVSEQWPSTLAFFAVGSG